MREKDIIYKEIGAITGKYNTKEFICLALSVNLSVAPVNSIREVAGLEYVKNCMMKTKLPDGKQARLSPPSYTTEFLRENNFILRCAPRLGEQNNAILNEIGLSEDRIGTLKTENII